MRAFPEKHALVAELFVLDKERNRIRRVVGALAMQPVNVPFYCFYQNGSGEEFSAFAKNAMEILVATAKPIQIAIVCRAHTQCDLQGQTRETLFREKSLSSALYTAYGLKLLQPLLLQSLAKQVKGALKEGDSLAISQSAEALDPFITFAEGVLKTIYSIPFSQRFSDSFGED